MAEIRNPNLQTQGGANGSGGGGDMRTMMTITFLMLLVFLGYDFFIKKPTAPAQQAQTTQQQQQATAASAPSAASATAQALALAAQSESETTIENPQYRIVFTNRGAQIKHWVLKNYNGTDGKPLDMVQAEAARSFGLPLSLFTYEPALTQQLNNALYQVSTSGAAPVAGHATAPATNAITFHYAANGLEVLKTVRFDASYVVTVENQVLRNGQPVRTLVSWPAGLGDMDEFVSGSAVHLGSQVRASAGSVFAYSIDGKDDSMAVKKISGNNTLNGSFDYAAISDLYFAAAMLPDQPGRSTVVTLHNAIDLPSDPSDAKSEKKPADVIGFAVGNIDGYTRLRLFAGPKQSDLLKSVAASGNDGKHSGPSLENLIQYGWLAVIAKPLYWALRTLHDHLPANPYNWGWAIIIVTVIFNMLMLPTRVMMMKSSLKMMRIQPRVESLKRKYAHLKPTDPKRAEMNQEMMKLYKDEGVNMYGSCLPMLFQMPLFFAYYRVLYNAVDLRQVHWFWLHDLSVADPLHILPIIILVSMFTVQMMTPAAGMDPNQRRMMAIMVPAIMGFSMWQFASGLALYWCTGNLINLLIQLSINKSSIGREMHALAAKRAAKKNGGNPKTIQGRR